VGRRGSWSSYCFVYLGNIVIEVTDRLNGRLPDCAVD
jgi:hypothetical protein